MAKDLNPRRVRSANPRARRLSAATGILSLFKVEYFLDIAGERQFFVSYVRANILPEATLMVQSQALRGGVNFKIHRKFAHGRDNSWMVDHRNYTVKILETKRYDFEIYEKVRDYSVQA